MDAAKQARNEYMRKWRAKNKDKVKQYNERHWKKKVEELNQAEEENNSENDNE